MSFDIYVWDSPRDVDDERAASLVSGWLAAGGDPGASPFEPSTNIGWFHRELTEDHPDLQVVSDAVPSGSKVPIWMSATDEAPARVVGIHLTPAVPSDALETILGLAAKYDLVLFDARAGRVHAPLKEMAAHASATFWPAGAVQAGVAGVIGMVLAVGAWALGIPLLSGAGGARRRVPVPDGAGDIRP